MKLNEDDSSDLPREKIVKYGASSLSNAELIAIFLSSGVIGRNVIQVAGDLLEKYGNLQELGRLPVSEYMNNKGIGPAKACKLAAAFELGTRLAKEELRTIPLDTPELIYKHFSHQMGNLPNETALVVTVNSRLEHTSTTTVSVGTVNETTAHPREVLRSVITRNAYGFILLHNHPSGDPSPSPADHRVTENLEQAANLMQIRLLDHIIIGRPSPGRLPYFSFRAGGKLNS
ncbi:RadC family protein [Luteolibacter sp. AS25]|uniref:RadC family protein n=1 Tax=Luteolibacter sp. AS25 TaxID=3135776 RepID=UPI00398B549F